MVAGVVEWLRQRVGSGWTNFLNYGEGDVRPKDVKHIYIGT